MKEGWKTATLGDVCKTTQGIQIPKSEQESELLPNYKRYLYISDFKNEKNLKYVKNNNTEKIVTRKDLIVVNTGASAGDIFKGIDGVLSNNLFKVSFNDRIIDPDFIFYFVTSDIFKSYQNHIMRGAANPHMGHENFKSTPFKYPLLQDQQHIVAILDEAFAAIDKAKENAEQNLKNAKELFESYLKGVFESKGDGWINATIGETCNLQTGGTPSTRKKEYYDGGVIKWLVSGDINQKVINDCEGRITELGMNNSNTKYLPINSVLIALNGQGKTRGTVAMLRTKATCNQSLVSIYPKDDKSLLPELVFSNLEGRYEEIRKMTGDSGNDRRGLNMPLIRSIKFSYPKKLIEQNEIIKKLNEIRFETKKLGTIYQQKINDLEELKKSVLQKAFNGELKTEKSIAL